MYAAHTDEIGFIVKKIEADGRLRVHIMGWNWAGSAYNARGSIQKWYQRCSRLHGKY